MFEKQQSFILVMANTLKENNRDISAIFQPTGSPRFLAGTIN
jgi:hypothetical protein